MRLTLTSRSIRLGIVQLMIDIPEKLAQQLESEKEHLGKIIARGLRRGWSGRSAVRQEVISFLANQPTAQQIVNFRPSNGVAMRAQELLERNQEGALAAEEEAELDEICEVDRFISLLKTQVLLQSSVQK